MQEQTSAKPRARKVRYGDWHVTYCDDMVMVQKENARGLATISRNLWDLAMKSGNGPASAAAIVFGPMKQEPERKVP